MSRSFEDVQKEIAALQKRIADLSRQQGQLEVLIVLKRQLRDLKARGRR